MDDLISRQRIKNAVEKITHYEWDFLKTVSPIVAIIDGLPSEQQNRIAREIAGKSPEEIYDFLHWLMSDYARQFTDSRLAVIEWLKGEEDDR